MKPNDILGKFHGPAEVRLVRTLPGPIERVWSYLVDPEKRARWLCGGVLEQRAGGKVVFAMVHKNLAPGETPPARFAQVQDPGVTFAGRVLRCEPPRLLAYTFGSDDSEVTFELTPQGREVLLVLTHRTRGAEEQADLTNYAAGWHTHLTLLIALLENSPRPPFWATHARLVAEYEKLRPAASEADPSEHSPAAPPR
ncbi:MAG: SRPBCC family protein [Opitutae bacterium]|nr:SRPBCC family protein [Opitutae bacterium]